MQVGDVVDGKYELIRLLGEGGMGAVFEAYHKVIGKKFALKCLLPSLATNEAMVTRFIGEARAAASIGSDHIILVTDGGTAADGSPYIVMEYIDGLSLGELMKSEGPLKPARAAGLISQLCQALSAAHVQGIIHRDIKPANLMITDREGVGEWLKVLDFGIAKLRAELTGKSKSLTRSGTTLGTPYYMAPEQFMGTKTVDQRADVYATGVILYELFTGKLPYRGATYEELIVQVATGTAPRPSSLNPSVSNEVEAVIVRAMARDKDDRFPTMNALDGALKTVIETRLSAQVPGTVFALADEKPREPPPRTATPPEPESPLDGMETLVDLGAAPRPPLPQADLVTEEPAAPAVPATAVPVPAQPSTIPRTAAPVEPPPPTSVEADPSAETSPDVVSPTVAGAAPEEAHHEPLQPPVASSPPAYDDGLDREAHRSRTGLYALGGVALVAIVIGLFFAAGGSTEPEPTLRPEPPSEPEPEPETPSPEPEPEPVFEEANRWISVGPAPPGWILGLSPENDREGVRGLRRARGVTAPTGGFELQQHEVTWGEIRPWLKKQPSDVVDPLLRASDDRLPATGLSWALAKAYCQSIGGRLPLENEWEFAARGSERRPYPWGSEPLDTSRTHAFRQSQSLSPVMSNPQDVTPGGTARGLFDLAGNAKEWVEDVFIDDEDTGEDGWACPEEGSTCFRTVRGLPPVGALPEKLPAEGAAYRDSLCATGCKVAQAYTQALAFVGVRCAR